MKIINPIATGKLLIGLGLDIMFHPNKYDELKFSIEPEFLPHDDIYLWPPIPDISNIRIYVRKNNRTK